ncbi:MAG: Sec-independent protein translocase protein TatB [Litorimonas sp.]
MLPSFGFGEVIIIVLLAVIVVGPKDLPKVMRTLGGFMARLRIMGQEFRDAFDEMDADDEIKSLRAEIAEMKKLGLMDEELDKDLRDLNTDLRDATDLSSDKT